MDFGIIKTKIESWLQPVLNERNLFLVDVRFSMGRKIEVYVDSDEGIHIDECAAISRLLEKELDTSGLVPENYILEVSSPGMTNPFKVPRQYKRRIGRILEITLNNGNQITAKLVEADNEKIKLLEIQQELKKKEIKSGLKQPEPKEYMLKYDEIKKAVLEFKF